MLRVYQRSPMTRSSSVHTIYCTPHHSPRPSLIATGSLSRQGSQDASLFIKHKKTASSSALETSSKLSQDDLFQKIQSLQAEVYEFPISLQKHAHAKQRDFLSFIKNRLAEAVLTSIHNLCFEAKIRKIGLPLQNPSFTI